MFVKYCLLLAYPIEITVRNKQERRHILNLAYDDFWQYREIQCCLWGKATCFGFSSLVSEGCCTAKPPAPSTVLVLLREYESHCLHNLSPGNGIIFDCCENLKLFLCMMLLLCPLASSRFPWLGAELFICRAWSFKNRINLYLRVSVPPGK